MKEKRKTYDSIDVFETDRAKMWSKGWLVLDHRAIPYPKPFWTSSDSRVVRVFFWDPLDGWAETGKVMLDQTLGCCALREP